MKKRMEDLYLLINEYNDEYYNNNNSKVSDNEYDKLFLELVELEKNFPSLKRENSPTNKVGGEVDNRFKKVAHKQAMLSLDNAFSYDDLIRFDQNVKKVCDEYSYVCELKIDGLAMSFIYEDGSFVRAVTRGDGSVGEDVTHNVVTINNLLKTVENSGTFEVRGEVFISTDEFERLNDIQVSKGLKAFANPRNLAAGSIRQLDSQVSKSRKLDAFIYSLSTRLTKTHYDDLKQLEKMGFNVNSATTVKSSIEEVIEYVKYYDNNRHNLPYETDGIVIKVNEYEKQDLLGHTSRAPKWAIAYKYKAEQVETKINDIVFQVGRTGKVTPVANLESVSVSGSVVKRATLHNENYIKEKDICIGDYVLVHKAGEIIPEVVNVVIEKRKNVQKFFMIKNCPVCNSKLEKIDANYFCLNEDCDAKILRKLSYFTSIDAMNIEGLGERNLEILFELDLVKEISDIYELHKHYDKLVTIEGFGDKRVSQLLKAIESSKQNKLEQFVTGLGIKNVGKKLARVLVNHFGSLQAIMDASVEELEAVNEIGSTVSVSVYEYFKTEKFEKLEEYIRNNDFKFVVSKTLKSTYSDKIICVTGSFENYKRKQIENYFSLHGAKVSSSVTSKTDYLIVGSKAGSKLKKALEFEVEIIDENQLNLIMEESNE